MTAHPIFGELDQEAKKYNRELAARKLREAMEETWASKRVLNPRRKVRFHNTPRGYILNKGLYGE